MQKSTSVPEQNQRGCVTLDNDEAWNEFFALQNDPSTNTTNPKPFCRKVNKYNGKDIKGEIAERIKEEISKNLDSNEIKFIRLKEGKREGNVVYPTLRVVLSDNEKKVNVTKLLSGNVCKKYGLRTITFCHPNQNKTRGACCYINDVGERVYDMINGAYEMTFKWYVERKECKITIHIDDEGTIRLLENNGVTEDQLLAYREVKVGKKREAKYLHEVLISQLTELQKMGVEAVQTAHEVSMDATEVNKAQEYLAQILQIG